MQEKTRGKVLTPPPTVSVVLLSTTKVSSFRKLSLVTLIGSSTYVTLTSLDCWEAFLSILKYFHHLHMFGWYHTSDFMTIIKIVVNTNVNGKNRE